MLNSNHGVNQLKITNKQTLLIVIKRMHTFHSNTAPTAEDSARYTLDVAAVKAAPEWLKSGKDSDPEVKNVPFTVKRMTPAQEKAHNATHNPEIKQGTNKLKTKAQKQGATLKAAILDIKAVNTSDNGVSLSIEERVNVSDATPTHNPTINELEIGVVDSVVVRGYVQITRQQATRRGENVGNDLLNDPWQDNDAPTFYSPTGQATSFTSKATLSRESINDVNTGDIIQVVVDGFKADIAQDVETDVWQGVGNTNPTRPELRGLNTIRVDSTNGYAEGLKPDVSRNFEFIQCIKSGVNNQIGDLDQAVINSITDNINKLITASSKKDGANRKFYIPTKQVSVILSIKDNATSIYYKDFPEKLRGFDVIELEDEAFTVDGQINGIGMAFGVIDEAIDVNRKEIKGVQLNPYDADGAVIVSQQDDIVYVESMKDNKRLKCLLMQS